MPKFHGYTERLPFNSYDAFRPREFRERQDEFRARGWKPDNKVPLFGNKNIGHLHLCNTACHGIVASDQTAFIQNWYARANFDQRFVDTERATPAALEAWVSWTKVTTVTMVMGSRPVAQLPLSDLLRRDQTSVDNLNLGYICPHRQCVEPCHHPYDALAAHMFRAATEPERLLWDRVSERAQDRWRRVARAACDLICRPAPIILPVRQSFYVEIHSEPRALGALVEVMPTNISPQALVWIHIEGVAGRDVA